jgi:hypothetical protein
MYKFKRDNYQKNRGGTSRILDVSCGQCDHHITFYQKDGPGILKRMYVDRFIDFVPSGSILLCQSCGSELGNEMTYKKEDRPAYRIYAGAVHKRIIAANKIPQKH